MEASTGECLKARTKDSNPGVYHEFPKTHKILNEETHNYSQGFHSRGIVSCNNTPTEALQDYSEMMVSLGMKNLISFRKDTKHVLQKIDRTKQVISVKI